MDSFVKHVFTFLLWVSIAWIMYLVLFGTYGLNGQDLTNDTAYTGNTSQIQTFRGVLWYMALAVEVPVAKYYYDFCYLPNVHANDYVDSALGGSPNSVTFGSGRLYDTATDLFTADSDMYDIGSVKKWSSGWVQD